jgi:nitrate/nitrite transport system substrate-binding protein
VFLITDAKKQMKNAGWRPPEGAYRKFKVMGKECDPAKPEEYVKSFAIHKLGG